jgi:hypothetical protein
MRRPTKSASKGKGSSSTTPTIVLSPVAPTLKPVVAVRSWIYDHLMEVEEGTGLC